MILSFFVAVIVTPWLMVRFGSASHGVPGSDGYDSSKLGLLYKSVARPILVTKARSWMFLILVGIATLLSMGLVAAKLVTVKLLPFDNKSELQVIVDLPRGTSLEETDRVLNEAAQRLAALPELSSVQAYAEPQLHSTSMV